MTDQIEISSWAPLKLKSDALPIELSGAGFFLSSLTVKNPERATMLICSATIYNRDQVTLMVIIICFE